MKKRTAIIATIVLFVAITTFAIISHQRRSSSPFLELNMLHSHILTGQPFLTFIVENDRTLTSYYRLRPSGVYEDREEVILTEQEFQHISELLSAVVDDYHYAIDSWLPGEYGSAWFILRHNGYEYVNSIIIPNSLLNLYDELRRLSPLNFPR